MEKEEIQELIENGILQENPDAQLVKDELANLSRRGFIRELSDQFFEFENNLTWEVVYETLLYAERRRLHALVAQHIEKQNDKQVESMSDVLAYHYEKSGNIKKSIWYLALAGERAADMYANDDALTNYNRALELLEHSGKMLASDKCKLLEKIADVYMTKGQFKESEKYYVQVLELIHNNMNMRKSKLLPWNLRNSTRESELCMKLAITSEAQAEYKSAIRWLDKAQGSLPMRPGRVASKIAAIKSGVLYRLGEYEEAVQWGRMALKRAKRIKIEEDVAFAKNRLALIYLAQGRMNIAKDNFTEAADVYEKLKDYPYIAVTKSNLALCSTMMGELSSAIDNYLQALEADKRIQNVPSMAMDHANLAEVLLMVGDIERAESYLVFVEKAFEDGMCQPDLAGLALIYRCNCEMIKGDLIKSQEAIDKGLELIRSAGQKVILGQAELQMAELLYAKGEYTQAEEKCLGALSIIEELGMKPLEVIGKRILAEVKNGLGFEDDAIDNIHDSIEMAKEIGAKYDEAKSVVVMVKIMRGMLNAPLREAAQNQCLRRATKMLIKMGAKRDLAEAKRLRIH
jgi:tetratricopeptide (TPR) repeat protein